MTNMTDLRTCSVGSVHMFIADVLVVDGQRLELAGDMVGGARVHVPVGVNFVGCSRRGHTLLRWYGEGRVEPLEATNAHMPVLAVELASDTRWRATLAASIAASSHLATTCKTTMDCTMTARIASTTATALGHHVDGGLMTATVELHSVFKTNELSIQLTDRN